MSKTIKRLCPPALPDVVLERPEVNRVIDAAANKEVIFIHAPAGFGKTLAMSMWLQKNKTSAAWIALTSYDDSPSIFCRYLLKALSSLGDDTAEGITASLDDAGFDAAPFEYLFKALSSMPDDCTEGLIILDDFHLIANESLLSLLPQMIRKLSPAYKFVILSRQSLPASFADFALKNRVGEITGDDLRFTRKQIVGLYKANGMELSFDDVLEVEAKTDGWALGLAARLLSIKAEGSKSRFSQASGEQYINHYLKSEIWDKWDESTQDFLLRTSLLEDLPPMLCDLLCNCSSKQVLTRLMNSSGLVICLSDGSYRYHHVLRDFLRLMAEERQIDLSSLYLTSAEYMRKAGNFIAALDYYVKSKNYGKLSNFLLKAIDYNFLKISMEEYYFSFKNLVLDKVPMEVLEKNVPLVSVCAYINLVTGNSGQMEYWFSKAQRLLGIANDIQTVGTLHALLFLDPYLSPWKFTNLKMPGRSKLDTLPSISLTMNLPFFHRALRDYSECMADWEELLTKLRFSFEPILGIHASVMVDGITSGIFYEQNKLTKAKECALVTLGHLTEKSNPELFFSVYMHIAAVLFAEDDNKGAWEVIGKAQVLVENSALYLKKNLIAMITKYRLYKGGKEAAGQWLLSYGTSGSSNVHLYHNFQVTTTVRAQIATGDFSSALILLAGFEKLAHNCRRPLDRLEALILRAIILWRQRQRAGAVETLRVAVLLAWPCGYIRMFANEGAAVLPILQKLYKVAVAQAEEDALQSFIRELIFTASETAKTNPGIVGGLEEQPIRLSKQQKLMLSLLASGMNNRQICEKTGLKLNTVKAHLYKLYEKLEVNSGIEAVLKARRINLLPKSK